MNAWSVAAVALLVGGLGPALIVGARDGPLDRLVGLEQAGAVATAVLLVVSHAGGASFLLTVPLVMVLASFAGTLVFTRLLGPRE